LEIPLRGNDDADTDFPVTNGILSPFTVTFDLTENKVETIAKGGRAQRNIQEGFNEQKTGYELEHFCRSKALDLILNLYGRLPPWNAYRYNHAAVCCPCDWDATRTWSTT